MVGDGDEEFSIEHTLALRDSIPNAQLAVLPGVGHGATDIRAVVRFLTAVESGVSSATGTGGSGLKRGALLVSAQPATRVMTVA